jgi:hypothetical protein
MDLLQRLSSSDAPWAITIDGGSFITIPGPIVDATGTISGSGAGAGMITTDGVAIGTTATAVIGTTTAVIGTTTVVLTDAEPMKN